MLAQTIISARAVYRFEVKHIGNLDLPVSAATPRKTRIVRLAQNLTQKEETSYASSRLEQRRQESRSRGFLPTLVRLFRGEAVSGCGPI